MKRIFMSSPFQRREVSEKTDIDNFLRIRVDYKRQYGQIFKIHGILGIKKSKDHMVKLKVQKDFFSIFYYIYIYLNVKNGQITFGKSQIKPQNTNSVVEMVQFKLVNGDFYK